MICHPYLAAKCPQIVRCPRLVKRVIISFSAALITLLVISLAGFYLIERWELQSRVLSKVSSVRSTFLAIQKQDVRLADLLAARVQDRADVAQACQNHDQSRLYQDLWPLYKQFGPSPPISSLNLIDSGGRCFFRLRAPDAYGDMVNHGVFAQARATGAPASGLGMDPSQNLVMNYVFPWRMEDQPTRYLEFGIPIGRALAGVSKALGVQTAVFLNKHFLNRFGWGKKSLMARKSVNWNQFRDFVVASQTFPDIALALGRHLRDAHAQDGAGVFELEIAGRKYGLGFFPIFDVFRQEIGQVAVLLDVGFFNRGIHAVMGILVFAAVVAGSLLLLGLWFQIDAIQRRPLEFRDSGSLTGRVLTTGDALILNGCGDHCQSGDLPEGHPGTEREGTRSFKTTRAEEVFARSLSDTVVQSFGDGILVTDQSRRILMMNRAAEQILERRYGGLEFAPISAAIGDPTVIGWFEDTLRKQKTSPHFDFHLNGAVPGTLRTIRARISPVPAPDGGGAAIWVFYDVTWKRVLEQRRKAFLARAAHELRTPLTTIQGFSELLMTSGAFSQEDVCKYMGYINQKALQLGQLITALVTVSTMDAGKPMPLKRSRINFRQFIQLVADDAAAKVSDHRIEVVLPPADAVFEADKDKLFSVFWHLVENAVKFSEPGTLIQIIAEVDGKGCRIQVRDQGIGMDAAEMENLFEPLYKVDTSDSAKEGAGLGLALVKFIVQSHGGRIEVKSDSGQGTTVTVVLPETGPDTALPTV